MLKSAWWVAENLIRVTRESCSRTVSVKLSRIGGLSDEMWDSHHEELSKGALHGLM